VLIKLAKICGREFVSISNHKNFQEHLLVVLLALWKITGALSKNQSIMKFAGIFSEIMNDLPSGHNEAMAIEEALTGYMIETKKAFKYIEGYNLLKGAPSSWQFRS
jgi:hypothetical protein